MADEPSDPSAQGEEAKPLDVRVTELENKLQGLTGTFQPGVTPALICRTCFECSCGPCNECSGCRVCEVCRLCRVCESCRICRVCEVCFECSCGPCAR